MYKSTFRSRSGIGSQDGRLYILVQVLMKTICAVGWKMTLLVVALMAIPLVLVGEMLGAHAAALDAQPDATSETPFAMFNVQDNGEGNVEGHAIMPAFASEWKPTVIHARRSLTQEAQRRRSTWRDGNDVDDGNKRNRLRAASERRAALGHLGRIAQAACKDYARLEVPKSNAHTALCARRNTKRRYGVW